MNYFEFQYQMYCMIKKGDYCWFKNEGYNLCVAKFVRYDDTKQKYIAINEFDGSYSYFDYCEKFIGELPTI